MWKLWELHRAISLIYETISMHDWRLTVSSYQKRVRSTNYSLNDWVHVASCIPYLYFDISDFFDIQWYSYITIHRYGKCDYIIIFIWDTRRQPTLEWERETILVNNHPAILKNLILKYRTLNQRLYNSNVIVKKTRTVCGCQVQDVYLPNERV